MLADIRATWSLVRVGISGPWSQNSDLVNLRKGLRFCTSSNSQVMLMLMVQGPYLDTILVSCP